MPAIELPSSLSERYKILKDLGHGAYGIVCSASDTVNNREVAIKKVHNVFDKPILAKRALREIKLLRHFAGHENITSILDMEVADFSNFNEIYISQELMEADLHQIIRSEQPLTDAHYQFFIYQICRGLKYIHSANVLHRDLKPGNLLVNADCELKICDFGLARGLTDVVDPGFMTEYVATRWYRAPEIMLSFRSYTKAVDMWSVGCILAELLGKRPIFKGKDYVDQLNKILGVLGSPDESTLARIGSERAQMYIRSLPKMKKIPWHHLYPTATVESLDLLEKLLCFDPANRIDVDKALQHVYLSQYFDGEEPVHPKIFDFSFEKVEGIPEMKQMIASEVCLLKKEHGSGWDNLPKVAGMVGVQRPSNQIEEEEEYGGAMDVDEELRIKGH